MEPMAVSVGVVRPLRQEILRPGRAGEEVIFHGDEDPETLHLAVSLKDTVVGVATAIRSPYPHDPRPGDWRIRGMATSADLRGQGIGGAMLAACEAHVRHHHGIRLWCNARVGARAFYERGGLVVEGDAFEIAAIGPHYLMSKSL